MNLRRGHRADVALRIETHGHGGKRLAPPVQDRRRERENASQRFCLRQRVADAFYLGQFV
nr:hypothetical protein [Paraburkholderia adhaesiva]